MKKNTSHKAIVESKPANAKSALHLPKYILFFFGFLLYANTLSYEYALDDKIVITFNNFTKQGTDGIDDIFKNDSFVGFFGKQKNLVEGGRYRPLTLAYFAVIWEFFGPEPNTSPEEIQRKADTVAHILHFSNALFYGLTALLLYSLLLLMFKTKPSKDWYFSLPFVATAIFIAHPLHTEVVANIKSFDEIVSFMGALCAVYFSFLYIDKQKKYYLGLAFVSFFLALLAKESVVPFIGIVPLSLYFFRKQAGIDKILFASLTLLVCFGFYYGIRSVVLGDLVKGKVVEQLMNTPFMYAKGGQKLATILFTMLIYLKLLVFPHPLTHDYYPWHPLTTNDYQWGDPYPYLNFNNGYVLLSLAIYLGITAYGIMSLFKRENKVNVYGYAILFFLGAFILFSNLFFEIGAFMNERFMYAPSLGFAIALAYFISNHISTLKKAIFLLIVCGFSVKTISRNKAWETDEILAIADYETSKNSSKVNMAAGGGFWELAKKENNPAKKAALLEKSISCLQRSLRIYPTYIQSKTLLGHAYYDAGKYAESAAAYESALAQDPNFRDVDNAIYIIAPILNKDKKFKEEARYLEIMVKYHPNEAKGFSMLGELYGKDMGDLNMSKKYLLKAYELSPNDKNILQQLGVAHAITRDYAKALEFLQKSYELDPKNVQVLMNMCLVYHDLGKEDLSLKYKALAQQLDPSIK